MRHAATGLGYQLRRSRGVLVAAVVPAAAIVLVAVVASRILAIPVDDLLSDPLSRFDAHPLTGAVSNLGALLWAAAAGVCFVAVLALRHGRDAVRAEERRFLAASGTLTTLLVLDDMFQLHEDLVPRLLGHGQTFILLGYVILVAGYLWRFRQLFAATEWMILVAAGAGFALSISMDLLPVALAYMPGGVGIDMESDAYELVGHVLEDGAKFIGISLWLTYFLRTAAPMLAPSPPPDQAGNG